MNDNHKVVYASFPLFLCPILVNCLPSFYLARTCNEGTIAKNTGGRCAPYWRTKTSLRAVSAARRWVAWVRVAARWRSKVRA